LFLLVACAGCVQAPSTAPETSFTFESARTPYSATICIARNARSLANVMAEERLLGDTGWEVIVHNGSDTLAVAEARSRPRGSIVLLRVTPVQRGNAARFAQQLMSDCQARMVER
jgi:hypothetical protein